MEQISKITEYLDNLLDSKNFKDASLNGLQVESKTQDIALVAFAVDAGLSVLKQAIEAGASLVIVHHGIFWGKEAAIRGPLRDKIELLLSSGCSLYASHLPLDAHPEVGNNYELARLLELKKLTPFFELDGRAIGCSGRLDNPASLDYFTARLANLDGAIEPTIFKFGSDKVSKIGIITGSGSSALNEAKSMQLDLLISGEPKHEAYHTAKELGINAIFAGHYATETVGPKALMRKMQRELNIKTIFVDEGTGI
ncbi:MAG: Nif3-like dinuclear metal center hexameric protein [Bdellovibrionota bacterium]